MFELVGVVWKLTEYSGYGERYNVWKVQQLQKYIKRSLWNQHVCLWLRKCLNYEGNIININSITATLCFIWRDLKCIALLTHFLLLRVVAPPQFRWLFLFPPSPMLLPPGVSVTGLCTNTFKLCIRFFFLFRDWFFSSKMLILKVSCFN
jgi:hypothetical protein